MKILKLISFVFAVYLFVGCEQETLVAEIDKVYEEAVSGDCRFRLKDQEGKLSHRWTGEDLTFELVAGKNQSEDIYASFVTDTEVLSTMVVKYAELKGLDLYTLLPSVNYELPEQVILKHSEEKTSVTIKIKDVKEGIFVLPLVLMNKEKEIGVQYIEIVKLPTTDIDMRWLDRIPTVDEPRFVAVMEASENDFRNLGNYMWYPEGLDKPELKRPLFDITVLFSANMNFDELTGKPVLYFNDNVKRILNNRDIFIKPLQDKGIKVLLSIMPNHQGIGFCNLDITGDRNMIKDFAAQMVDAVKEFNLDGIMFDDEYAEYPTSEDAEQPGRPMIQMGSFHFLIKELRQLMPIVAGQAWKDRHNLITFYNIGYCSTAVGSSAWSLFSNRFDVIKQHIEDWEDEKYGNQIKEDKKALRTWVEDPINQPVLDEIAQIKAGEVFDFIWNCNYLRGDNYTRYPSSVTIAGLDKEIAKTKYGLASFEMSLKKTEDGIVHQEKYWQLSNWEAGTPGRIETLAATLDKQKVAQQTTLLVFNIQYIPSIWNNQEMRNIYLDDFKFFLRNLGNTKQPEIKFEGVNYNCLNK